MKNSFKVILSALVLISSAGCRSTVVDSPGPVTEVCCGGQISDTDAEAVPGILSANLKTIAQGPEATHTFVVTNKSESEYAHFEKPAQVNLPCCVTAELSRTKIPPGETAQLKVTYKTRIRPGPFDIFVRLFPEKGEVVEQYHLSGQVEKSFVLKPKKLNLAKQRSQEFKVSGQLMGSEYAVEEVKSNSPHLIVQEVGRQEREITYQVTWDGEPVEEDVPVVYVITDSEMFGWAPVLIKGVKLSAER